MPVDPPSFGGLLLQLVLSLAVVVGLAYLVIRFGLARWLGTQATEARHMEVLETLSLGPRHTSHRLHSGQKRRWNCQRLSLITTPGARVRTALPGSPPTA